MSADIWIWLSFSVSSLASVFTRCNNLNERKGNISRRNTRRRNIKRDEIVVMTCLYEALFDIRVRYFKEEHFDYINFTQCEKYKIKKINK